MNSSNKRLYHAFITLEESLTFSGILAQPVFMTMLQNFVLTHRYSRKCLNIVKSVSLISFCNFVFLSFYNNNNVVFMRDTTPQSQTPLVKLKMSKAQNPYFIDTILYIQEFGRTCSMARLSMQHVILEVEFSVFSELDMFEWSTGIRVAYCVDAPLPDLLSPFRRTFSKVATKYCHNITACNLKKQYVSRHP